MRAAPVAPGLVGALTAWLWAPTEGGLPLIGVAVLTLLSCAFGMASSLARVEDAKAFKQARRQLIWNAGGVWIASLMIALMTKSDLPWSLGIGLGVGMAGTRVLEVLENGVVGLTRRVAPGADGLDEVRRELSDIRKQTQAAISEERVSKDRKAKGANDDGTQ